MPRRRSPEKRKVIPDPKYKDIVLAKFMNNLMKDGKKSVAEKIVYGAFDQITKSSQEDPLSVFMKALEEDEHLKNGLNIQNGLITHSGVKEALE